jgi:uncharacterized protein YndB with AHSA1/START domain
VPRTPSTKPSKGDPDEPRHPDQALTVRIERLLPGPVERVWAYLTESKKRATWLAAGEFELRVGGRIELLFDNDTLSDEKSPARGPACAGSRARSRAWSRNRALAYTWNWDGKDSEVLYELQPKGKDVLLTIQHRLPEDRRHRSRRRRRLGRAHRHPRRPAQRREAAPLLEHAPERDEGLRSRVLAGRSSTAIIAASRFRKAAMRALAWFIPVLLWLAGCAAPEPRFEPHSGQPGKDVVWVPTPQVAGRQDARHGEGHAADFVMDLGSGDGRTVITAAKRGARAAASSTTRTWSSSRKRNAERKASPQGALRARPICSRPTSPRPRDHHVPAAGHQPEAAAEDPRPQARHARRLQQLHHGDWEPDHEPLTATAAATPLVHGALWIVPANLRGTYTLPMAS